MKIELASVILSTHRKQWQLLFVYVNRDKSETLKTNYSNVNDINESSEIDSSAGAQHMLQVLPKRFTATVAKS